jgi:hypothetical protein
MISTPLFFDDGDDRMQRWMRANGVTKMDLSAMPCVRYYRADGSEVDPETSYPYDALLTPYTESAGQA